MAYRWFWNVVTTKKWSMSCSLMLHCHILTTSNTVSTVYTPMYLNSYITFSTHYGRKENLGYWIPLGVSQRQVMLSSSFLLNCRWLKPYIKLKFIKLAFLINHQFKKNALSVFLGFFNANIRISFRKLKLTAVLFCFVLVMLIAVKPGQTPVPCP